MVALGPYDYWLPALCFLLVFSHALSLLLRRLKSHWYQLLILAILAASFCYQYQKHPFYGLEYEDAYAFQADTRLPQHHLSESQPFRIQLSHYQSSQDELSLYSYDGHFTAFSSIGYYLNLAFGYSNMRLLDLSFIILIVKILLIYYCVSFFFPKVVSFLAASSLLMVPSSNVFSTTALSETFSSGAALIFFMLLLRHFQRQSKSRLIWVMIALFSALLVKRENLYLVAALPLYMVMVKPADRIRLVLGTVITLITFFILVAPFKTEFFEAEHLGRSTFSLEYISIQLPVYLCSFFKPTYSGFYYLIALVSFVSIFIIKRKERLFAFLSIGAFALVLVMYTSHYRGSFMLETQAIEDFHTFRYLNNFNYLLVPLFATGLNAAHIRYAKYSIYKLTLLGVVLFVLSYSWCCTQELRQHYSNREFLQNFQPVILTNKYFSEGEYQFIVTESPCVFSVLQSSPSRVALFSEQIDYQNTIDADRPRLFMLRFSTFDGLSEKFRHASILVKNKKEDYIIFAI